MGSGQVLREEFTPASRLVKLVKRAVIISNGFVGLILTLALGASRFKLLLYNTICVHVCVEYVPCHCVLVSSSPVLDMAR